MVLDRSPSFLTARGVIREHFTMERPAKRCSFHGFGGSQGGLEPLVGCVHWEWPLASGLVQMPRLITALLENLGTAGRVSLHCVLPLISICRSKGTLCTNEALLNILGVD